VSALFPFLIAGLVSGSVYGLAGAGLVLTYKTSGVFNFAHGALATIAAYLFYTLHIQHGLSWPVSAAISVLGAGVALGLAFEPFARRVTKAPIALQIAGTVGVVIAIEAVATLIYGPDPLIVPSFLPTSSFTIGGLSVTTGQVIIIAIGLVLTASLYVFLQHHRLGIAMRAVVDNPDLVSLSQFSPVTIRRGAWIIGCTLATLSGVLLVPSISLTPTLLTLLVVQTFGAAAIGRFSSLPLTYAGGLLLGLASSVATKYVGQNLILAGLPTSIPFIFLFLVLVLTPRGRLRTGTLPRVPLTLSAVRMPATVQALAGAPLLLLAALAPLFASVHLLVWGSGLVFVILFASMVLLVRVAGQVSLCHVAFAAIGASTFARLAGQHHLPWFLALVIAALCVVPIGAVLAIPASRLPVLYLGLATLGFGLLVQQMFYGTNLMFSPFANGLNVGRPALMTSDTGYYYLLLVLATCSVALIAVLVRTRLGRVLRGLSDSPLALSSLGTDERVTRVLVFCVAAFFAGLSGALYAGLLGNVSEQTFDPIASLTYLVVIVIVVGDPVWAAVGGAVGIAVIPGYVQSGNVSEYLQLIFGAIAIAVAVGPDHSALAASLQRVLARGPARRLVTAGGSIAPERVPEPSGEPVREPAATQPAARPKAAELEIASVSVVFGGVRALDNVSLAARGASITGLIGPNGAGKTTTFNVASGLIKPASGRVIFDGRDVTSFGTARRARLGLGRTFQQTELFASMTVQQNVDLGYEAAMAGANPLSHLVSTPADRHSREAAVAGAIELCGIADLRNEPASVLSTGQRRMAELARCLASPARLLLLDEPSAGLDAAETMAFGAILQRVAAERSMRVLLVEHDMDLVMRVCDYVYVLDFGELIFQGRPAEVQASPVVQSAYLGEPLAVIEGPPRALDDVER
jgi:ABC-type branched-subunit amino acid transport system ATPase component/branched-subunit amino acid ABC-type transport system permease component